MSDYEMPYFADGKGNRGFFVDPTAREQISDLQASRAIIVKASTSDYKNYSIPKTIWTTNGFSGNNHTALFCCGYKGRVSAGFLGFNQEGASVIQLGENPVTASVSGNNIIISFTNTTYTDMSLILFN